MARQLILDFKFRGALDLRDNFTDFLEATVRTRFRLDTVTALVPIPSTLLHRWLRGYSPTDILASSLSARLHLPLLHLLRRVGSPKRQSTLPASARPQNVRNTFALRSPARFSHTALLLDDILTTGATLSEASRILKTAGFSRVFAVTLARPAP